MWTDPLVEEIRKRRRELMAEFDYDPKKVINALKDDRTMGLWDDRTMGLRKKKKD